MPVVSDPSDEIREILIRYAKGDIGPPGADHEIMAILRRRGHVASKKIPPMLVGIHQLNRGGAIGTSKGVRTLMDKIMALNWNDDECRHAICVELEGLDRTDENEFRTWCENAGSDFPAVLPFSLKYASLACSHTNCGLRLIFSRCESSNLKLGDGCNYSVEVIRKRDAAYALAVEEGITWTVVPAWVLKAYPELIQLWSISRNTAGHVQQPVSEVTGLNLLYSLWTAKLANNESPCYTTIVMNVTRGEPWWHDQVDEFIAFLARHAGGTGVAALWKFFLKFHAHKVPSEERMMPVYVWTYMALMLQSRCAYACIFAIYTCPQEGGIVNKQCLWFSTTDLRKLVSKPSEPLRASAEDFLKSVAALFEEDGTIHTRVVAEATADPSTKGYETLEKAQRIVAQMSVDIYVSTAVMVGRHLCGKPQDEDFGKAKAENLHEIAARMRTLVGEAFPTLVAAEFLDTVVLPRIVLPKIPSEGLRPPTVMGLGPPTSGIPQSKGASAGSSAGASAESSAPVMPSMSTMNSQGERVGAIDRLNRIGMALGGMVSHRTLKGVYKLEGLDFASSAGATLRLSLVFKCVSMEQLWATLPGRGDPAQGSGTDEETAPEDTNTAGAELAAFAAVGAGAPLSQVMAVAALCSKAGAAKPPPTLAAPATSVIDTVPGGASAGADSGTPTAGSDKQGKSVVEFEPTKVVDLEDLLKEWKAEREESGKLVEYSFNAEWPEGRLTCNEKHLKNLGTAYVFTALATLGCKVDQGISPGIVLRHLVKPSVGLYVSTGELALGTNRQR